MIIDYLALMLLLFFITFFLGIFIHYIQHRSITVGKMFTYKKGGVFEHYIIVGGLMLVVIIGHIAFGLNPFELDSLQSKLINLVTLTAVGFIFLVFIFVFLFYFIAFMVVKISKIEDRAEFYKQHTDRMILTAFIISGVLSVMVLIIGIVDLFQ